MASTPQPSNAVVRKRADTDLMPPPPPAKRIKRPRQVLDEDSYTEALSQIIARDFFSGLLETQIQQEYLDAVESKDSAWISSAGMRLKQVMTPGRRPAHGSAAANNADQTPSSYVGDTPSSVAATVTVAKDLKPRLDINMSLSKFQATYTSEDNESFYRLIDRQNLKKAEKYGWLWRGNKLPSKQMIAQKKVQDEIAKTRSLVDDGFKRDRLAIKDADHRPARPDTWNAAPKNGLMFQPDGLQDHVVTMAQRAEDASRMAPRSIVYENTRMPQTQTPQRPPSPGLSAVRDAIAGRPRRQDQESSIAGGGETPRVNGYSFVDDQDDEPGPSTSASASAPVINLGPGAANSPFKIQEQRKRELLHERMVERIAKSKNESLRHGFTGKAATGETPRYMSSSRISGGLTPAAQRLLSTMATPGRGRPGESFGQGQPSPMRPRGSLLKSVKRPPNPK